jgi:hypothetical protein
MYIAKDYDDINTVAGGVSEILQKPDCAQVILGKGVDQYDYKVRVVPKVAQLVYSNNTVSGYLEPKARQWINTSQLLSGSFVDVPHYGIKFALDSSVSSISNATQIGILRVFMRVIYECKHNT